MAAPAQMRRMLLLGVATVLLTIVQADDFVGCLFSDTLCLDQVEWCYDDMALGRCIGVGATDEDSLYRYVGMTHAQRETVAKELRRVVARGYNLNHPYAQCRLQGALFAVRESLDFHATVCDHLADRDIEYAFQAANSEDINSGNDADEEPLAFVKFTPSINDPHADFADEVYYPPPEEVNFREDVASRNELEDVPPEQLLAEVIGEIDDIYNSPYEAVLEPKIVKKSAYFGPDFAFLPAMHRRSEPSIFSRHYNTPQDFRLGQETRDDTEISEGRPSFFEENDLPPYETQFERNPDMTLNSITERIYNPADMKYVNQPVSDFAQYSMTPANPLYNIEQNVFDPRYSNGFLSKSPEDNYEPDGRTDEYSTEDQFLEYLPLIDYLNKLNLNSDDIEHLLKPENIELLQSLLPDDFEDDENTRNDRSSDDILIAKWLESKAAEKLRNRLGRISDYSIRNYNDGNLYEMTPESRIYYEDDRHGETTRMGEDLGSGEQNEESVSEEINPDKQIFPELRMKNGGGAGHLNSQRFEKKMDDTVEGVELAVPEKAGVYTEGGIVFVPGNSASGIHDPMNAEIEKQIDSIMLDPDGFKRKERLDVKKPGPPFDIKTEAKVKINMADAKAKKDTVITHEPISSSEASHEQYDVDASYAYMDFKDSIRSWKEGHEIVYILAELLHLNPETFTHIRVERNEVTFKVKPNELGLNASMIALKIDEMKGALKEKAGVEVTAAGIGDKTKLPVVRSAIDMETEESILYEGRMLLAGCVIAAVLLAGGTLLLIRRHAKSRRKLQDLACGAGMVGPDTEASKDYQELCRSRMASKGGQPPTTTPIEKPEGGLHGRITSLSRESEGGSQQSPSSRSSTSSWSEEPALSNMDISTGHMVLAYMEDHLRNKDRLEQEWVALCAYEAEPCAATEASRPENKDKNRCPDVFPYDHSRVVLGRLANANESDYINASTITDHDPRNPAYIATQGPLPQTAADFWQMIWEQGSVVMVMLTRLTENGTAMSHRYWPEKESELYHIYEVHLVSEHIWCDDYLVRSFYLKNVKTGETRTVTQFHFLSWSEHSVPASTKALLEFRRKVNKSYRGRSCPIVVHCSDGAGRTGTYCLIDMVLNRMAKGAKEIDIAATLEHIRDQRPAMVATRQQFEFVLTAVAEEVHAILKALPPVQPNTTGDKP